MDPCRLAIASEAVRLGAMSIALAPLDRTARLVAAVDTTEVSDSGSTATVLVITVLLVLAALALAAITVWYWRNTVPDPEALASLAELSETQKRTRWKRHRRSNGE